MPTTTVVEVKSPFASLTNWTALITTAIGFLSMPELGKIVPVTWLPYILAVIGFLNLVLRNFFTNSPTTEIAAKKD